MSWIRRLIRGNENYAENWTSNFKKVATPIFASYLRNIVELTAYRGTVKASRQEVATLINSINELILPVVTEGEAVDAEWRFRGGYVETRQQLKPYIEQFLPYPLLTRALLGYEAMTRISFNADHLFHIEHIVAQMMHEYAPDSFSIMERMFSDLDPLTHAYTLKLEGYTSPTGVLYRYRFDLVGVLYQMAWPSGDLWPNKSQVISDRAMTYLISIGEWAEANDESILAFDVRYRLRELRKARAS